MSGVAAIEYAEEALLRRHLSSAHPKERVPEGLGEVLQHFGVERTRVPQ
jgi:hypothetical protein